MKKRRIITISAIIVAITGALLVLNFIDTPEDDFIPFEPIEHIYILGDETGDFPAIFTVDVLNEFGSFTIYNTKTDTDAHNRFTLKGFEDFDLRNNRIAFIANTARNLVASDILFEEGTNLDELGLINPTATVSITYLDGTSALLLIGDNAPGATFTYVKRDGDPSVYIISFSTAEYFLHRDLDFIELSITETIESIPDIRRAVLGGSKRPEPIVIESVTPLGENDPLIFFTHLITSPIQGRLDGFFGLEPLVHSYGLFANNIEARLEHYDELKLWGLDEPYSTLEILSTTNDSFKLIASAPGENGTVYIIRDDLPIIYNVNINMLPWFDITYFDMMDKLLIIPFVDTISLIELYLPNRDVKIRLEGEGQDLEIFVDDVLYTANESVDSVRNFRLLYQDILNTRIDSIPEQPMPQDAPVILQFVYNYRDSSPSDTVTFFESTTARKVYVRLNDETPMYVLSSFVDHLLRSFDSFLVGERVVVF